MRVFVGTMESGEGDFELCKQAISQQVHPHVHHFVVSGLREHEAHQRLYEEWEVNRGAYDLFLKVDADTVLAHPNVVSDIVALFKLHPRLTGLQAWLHDYMTNDRIFGLGCMRNTVALTHKTDPLYPDRVDLTHDMTLRGDALSRSLNPAGNHCHHATDEQAFRYGVHRTLKNQRHVIDQVRRAWRANNDRTRAFALQGSERALSLRDGLKISYRDEEFQAEFANASVEHEAWVTRNGPGVS